MDIVNRITNFFYNPIEKKVINNYDNNQCNESEQCFENKVYKDNKIDVRFGRMVGEDNYIKKGETYNDRIYSSAKNITNNYNSFMKEYAKGEYPMNNIRPVLPINVRPGLNVGYDDDDDSKYFGKNTSLINRVYPLYDDIDHRRTENNKQQSYTLPVNKSGINYIKPAQLGRVELAENKFYRNDNISNRTSNIKKPNIKQNFREHNNKISHISKSLGHVPTGNKGTIISGTVKKPNKIGPHTKNQPQIIGKQQFNNYHDDLKNTTKELHLNNNNNNMIMQKNTTVLNNYHDDLKNTLKEQNIQIATNKMVNGSDNIMYCPIQDELKHTQKEENVLLQQNKIINSDKNINGPGILDEIKHTNKENIVLLSLNNYITSKGTKLTTEIQDNLHTTKKELNILNTNSNNLSNSLKQHISNFQDTIKQTLKELNIFNEHTGNATNNTKDYYIDYSQIPETTLKELLCNSYNIGVASGIIKKHQLINLKDIPATTLKELVISNNYTGISNIGNGIYVPLQDELRQTLKSIKSVFYCSIVNGYKKEIDRNSKFYLSDNKMDIEYELSKIIKGNKSSNNRIPTTDNMGKMCLVDNILNIEYNISKVNNNINNIPTQYNIGKVCTKKNININDRIINVSNQLSTNPYVNKLMSQSIK